MIKRVFIFSDMEFDQARGTYVSYGSYNTPNKWETDYEVIREKFKLKGYGEAVPEMVFWNLRESGATPVSKNEKGCALVSGFSKNALKLFLEGSTDALDPESVMMSAISGKEYQKLVVLD